MIDSIGTTSEPGSRQKIVNAVQRYDKKQQTSFDDGSALEIELTPDGEGKRISVLGALDYYFLTGKRAKTPVGERTDGRMLIRAKLERVFDSGETHLFPCDSQLVPIQGAREQAPYILSLTTTTYGKFDKVKKKPRLLPAGGDPNEILTREYSVPAGFLHKLGKNAGLGERPTTKEVLAAVGISFPAGCSVTFVAGGSSIVMRNNRSAHQLLETLVESAQ